MVLAAGQGCWPRLLQACHLQVKPGSERDRAHGDRDQAWGAVPAGLPPTPPAPWPRQRARQICGQPGQPPPCSRTYSPCRHDPRSGVALDPPVLSTMGPWATGWLSSAHPRSREQGDAGMSSQALGCRGHRSPELEAEPAHGTCWAGADPELNPSRLGWGWQE